MRQRGTFRVLCAIGLLLAGNQVLAQGNGNIKDYVAAKLDDFTATMRVLQHDDRAGMKINKDFGLIYKLKGDVRVQYKDENKLRVDGAISASKATLIVNGTKQFVRVPSLGIKTTSDLGESPGKRKTLLDMGMISEGYLTYTQAEFRGERPFEGVKCAVFRISYRDKNADTSHRMVWIDPKTKITLKREEYTQEGKLASIYYYRDPKEVTTGIWFPSRIEVFNAENQKAGVTEYRDIKINVGLDEGVFRM